MSQIKRTITRIDKVPLTRPFKWRMNDCFFKSQLDAEQFYQFFKNWGVGNTDYDGIIDKQTFDCSPDALLKNFNGIFYKTDNENMKIDYFRLSNQILIQDRGHDPDYRAPKQHPLPPRATEQEKADVIRAHLDRVTKLETEELLKESKQEEKQKE